MDKKERNLLITKTIPKIPKKTAEGTAHLKFILVGLIRIRSYKYLQNPVQREAYHLQTAAEEQATRVEEVIPHLVNLT